MTPTITWHIEQLDRSAADDFVLTVHYRCIATDPESGKSDAVYGTCSYTQDPEKDYTPFNELTPEIVLGWVFDKLGKEVVEAAATAKLTLQLNPPVVSGLPWA